MDTPDERPPLPTPTFGEQIQAVGDAYVAFANALEKHAKPSTQRAVAHVRLKEALFWAQQAITKTVPLAAQESPPAPPPRAP